jgi:hypothetical protein
MATTKNVCINSQVKLNTAFGQMTHFFYVSKIDDGVAATKGVIFRSTASGAAGHE